MLLFCCFVVVVYSCIVGMLWRRVVHLLVCCGVVFVVVALWCCGVVVIVVVCSGLSQCRCVVVLLLC